MSSRKGKKHKVSKRARGDGSGRGEADNGSMSDSTPPPEEAGLEYQSSEGSFAEAEEDYFTQTEELSELIDQLTEKSSKTRLSALAKLNKTLSRKYWGDYLSGNVETLTDVIVRGIRKSSGTEREGLCQLAMLMATQLGEESKGMVGALQPLLLTLAKDPGVKLTERTMCVHTLGLCLYLAVDDPRDLSLIVDEFIPFFSKKEELALLCSAALSRWALVVSICRHPDIIRLVKRLTPVFLALMDSKSLAVKIAAGQATAALFELVPQDSEEVDNEWASIVDRLEELASESSRYVERKERNQQRVSFRDLHHSVNTGSVVEQKVSIDHERLCFDSWAMILYYHAVKELLGPGTAVQMKENPFLRVTFGLPPHHVKLSAHDRDVEHREKKLAYAVLAKERSKTRSKQRDKRTHTFTE